MSSLRLLVLLLGADLLLAAKLPSNFKRCPKSLGPTFDTCLIRAVEDGIRKMAHGVPSLGLPPLEPLEIERFSIGQDQNKGPVSLQMSFEKVKIYGISDITLTDQNSYYSDKLIKFETWSHNPKLRFEAQYEVDGRFLLLPVKGKGKAIFDLDEVDGKATLTGVPISKNGKSYYRLNKFEFTFNPSKVYIHLENLFDGNQKLGETTNKVLNENWEEVFGELKPAFEEVLSTVFKSYTERLYKKVPLEELYPNKL